MPQTFTTTVVGARGYAGLELARLILKHPHLKLTAAFATRPFHLEEDLLGGADVPCLTDDVLMDHLGDINFLCTPAEVSRELAPRILAAGKRVIDLSGAFRLSDPAPWYGFSRDSLVEAHYGLMPFAGPPRGPLVSNPGCFATAILMGLIPLLKHGLIDPSSLVIDAKSGTTGAGRRAQEEQLFAEVDGECTPYRIGRHQHLPEIIEHAARLGGVEIDPHFTTHLLPVRRGISAAIYARTSARDVETIVSAIRESFGEYPLVRLGTDETPLKRLGRVVGRASAHLTCALVGGKLYMFSLVDNLLKGAASQAIENANAWCDVPPATGLEA